MSRVSGHGLDIWVLVRRRLAHELTRGVRAERSAETLAQRARPGRRGRDAGRRQRAGVLQLQLRKASDSPQLLLVLLSRLLPAQAAVTKRNESIRNLEADCKLSSIGNGNSTPLGLF